MYKFNISKKRLNKIDVYLNICVNSKNEIRSLVSLGDGAAGGGSSASGLAAAGSRGMGTSGGTGTGTGTGESSTKRSNGNGRTPTGSSRKKKENSSGPLLWDNTVEWWDRNQVSHHPSRFLIEIFLILSEIVDVLL